VLPCDSFMVTIYRERIKRLLRQNENHNPKNGSVKINQTSNGRNRHWCRLKAQHFSSQELILSVNSNFHHSQTKYYQDGTVTTFSISIHISRTTLSFHPRAGLQKNASPFSWDATTRFHANNSLVFKNGKHDNKRDWFS